MTADLRPCPACAADQIRDLAALARDHWRIGVCTFCDLVFLRNPVDYADLEEDFAWEATYADAGIAHVKQRGTLKRLAYNARKLGYWLRGKRARVYARYLNTGKIIDIGCGGNALLDPPVVPFGIELSKALAKASDDKMRAQGGFCIQGPGAKAIWDFDENTYDGVLMHSYLEHEVEFDRVLRGSARALKPGGKVFIRVPNFASLNRRVSGAKWPGLRYPDHVNYFTPATLRARVEKAGLRFELVNRHKIWLDDNIQALATKPDTQQGAV